MSETATLPWTRHEPPYASQVQRVMAFELLADGHRPSYIRNFAEQWAQQAFAPGIDFVVSPNFCELHPDVIAAVEGLGSDSIRIHAISKHDFYHLPSRRVLREFRAWKLFCRMARELNADRALLMDWDRWQLPILLGQRSPCPVSGIYFRPTFHYSGLSNYHPTWSHTIKTFRKRALLRRVLSVKEIDTLFCLDPLAAEYIRKEFQTDAFVEHLPDSFPIEPMTDRQVDALRSELGIEEGRRVLLLLGILDARKGLPELLDAISALSTNSKRKFCLVAAGQVHPSIKSNVYERIKRLNSMLDVQIVLRDEFIAVNQVQPYYELADVSLTTYQQHLGVSAALTRAALAGIPSLSSDYGVMGELVRRHRLGPVVDTTNPTDFAAALESVIEDEPSSIFDENSARDFAAANSPSALGEALAVWLDRTATS